MAQASGRREASPDPELHVPCCILVPWECVDVVLCLGGRRSVHQSAIFVRGDCIRGRRRCFLGFTFVAEVLSRLASEPPFQAPTPLIYIFLGGGLF